MAFPAVAGTVATTSLTSAGTSHTVNLPSGITAGETLIIFGRTTSSSGNTGLPAGQWNTLKDVALTDKQFCAWRKADGSEGSTMTVTTVSSTKLAALVFRVSGAADPTVTPPEISTDATGSTATPNPNALTPTGGAKDYLWCWLGGWQGEQTSPPASNPTNYASNVTGADTGTAGSTATNSRVAMATRQLNAASEDPGSWTISVADQWAAWTLAVHPAPPVTPVDGAVLDLTWDTRAQADAGALDLEWQLGVEAGGYVDGGEGFVNNGTSLSVPLSARPRDGQTMFMLVTTNGTPAVTTPTGWTLLDADTANTARYHLFQRDVSGDSDPEQVDVTLASGRASAAVAVYEGDVQLASLGVFNSAAATTIDAAANNLPLVRNRYIYFVGARTDSGGGQPAITPDANATERQDVSTESGGANVAASIHDEAFPTPQLPVPTRTFTTSPGNSMAIYSLGIATQLQPVDGAALDLTWDLIAEGDPNPAVSGDTFQDSAASVVVLEPATRATKDQALLAVVNVNGAGINVVPPWGWDLLGEEQTTTYTAFYYKRARPYEPRRYEFRITSGGPAKCSAAIEVYEAQIGEIDVASAVVEDTSGDTTANTVTTSEDDTRVVYLVGGKAVSGAQVDTVPPAGVTQRQDASNATVSTNVSAAILDEAKATAGATTSRTFTMTNNTEAHVLTVALSPVMPATGGPATEPLAIPEPPDMTGATTITYDQAACDLMGPEVVKPTLDDATDYVFEFADTFRRTLEIEGGNNVLVKAAHQQLDENDRHYLPGPYRRGILLKDSDTQPADRIIHIEGLHQEGVSEGIDFNCPTASVRIGYWLTRLRGNVSTAMQGKEQRAATPQGILEYQGGGWSHVDGTQVTGGFRELFMDRCWVQTPSTGLRQDHSSVDDKTAVIQRTHVEAIKSYMTEEGPASDEVTITAEGTTKYNFDANITGWSGGGSASVSHETTNPITGAGSLRLSADPVSPVEKVVAFANLTDEDWSDQDGIAFDAEWIAGGGYMPKVRIDVTDVAGFVQGLGENWKMGEERLLPKVADTPITVYCRFPPEVREHIEMVRVVLACDEFEDGPHTVLIDNIRTASGYTTRTFAGPDDLYGFGSWALMFGSLGYATTFLDEVYATRSDELSMQDGNSRRAREWDWETESYVLDPIPPDADDDDFFLPPPSLSGTNAEGPYVQYNDTDVDGKVRDLQTNENATIQMGAPDAPFVTSEIAGLDYVSPIYEPPAVPVDGPALDLTWDTRAAVDGPVTELVWDVAAATTQVDGAELELVYDLVAETAGNPLELIWDAVGQVNAVPQELIWDTAAEATSAATELVWDLVAQVSGAELDVVWDLRAEAASTITELVWDLRSEAASAVTELVWDTRAQADGSALDLAYDLAAEVGRTITLVSDLVAQTAGGTLELIWDAAGQVNGAPDRLVWDLAAEVAGTALDVPWDLAGAVDGPALDALWDLAAEVFSGRTALWDLRAAADSAVLDLLWDLRAETAGPALDLVSDLLAAVSGGELRLVADLVAQVGNPLTLPWDLRGSVDADALDVLWDVETFGAVNASPLRIVSDLIAQAAGPQLRAVWDLHDTVSSPELILVADLRAETARALTARWDLNAAVSAVLSAVWDLRAAVGSALAFPWDLSAAADSDPLEILWDLQTIGAVNAAPLQLLSDLAAERERALYSVWDLRAETSRALELDWDLRATADADTLELIWDAVGQTNAAPLQLIADVRAERERQLSAVWDLRTAAETDPLDVVWDVRSDALAAALRTVWDTRAARDADPLQLVWDLRSALAVARISQSIEGPVMTRGERGSIDRGERGKIS